MNHKIYILSLLALVLGGCATPYAKVGFAGGYEETRLGPDTYAVSFGSNSLSGPQRTADFAMLRAAELAIAHGYDTFSVENSQATETVVPYVPSKPSQRIIVKLGGGEFNARYIQRSVREKYHLPMGNLANN
jgi:hypothetical protein